MDIRKLNKDTDYDWIYNEYHNKGKSAYQISKESNVNPSLITFYVNLWEIPNKSQRRNDIHYMSKEDLYEAYTILNMSISEISKNFSCPYMTVRCWIAEYELVKRNGVSSEIAITPANLYKLYILDNLSIDSLSIFLNIFYKDVKRMLHENDLVEFKRSLKGKTPRIDVDWLKRELVNKSKSEIIEQNTNYNSAQLEYHIDNIDSTISTKYNIKIIHQDSKRRQWLKKHYKDAGMTMSYICDIFGCGLTAVECYMEELNLPPLPIGHYEDERTTKESLDNKITDLILQGHTTEEVSVIIGYSYAYTKKIYSQMKKAGKI